MRRSTRSKTAQTALEGDFAGANPNPHSSLSVLENAGTTTGGVGRKQRRMTEENDGKGGEEKEDEKNESRRSPTIVAGSSPREVAEEMLEKESTEKETKNASSKCTEEEQKLRILLVEDDIPTSLIITSMLTQAGAVVTNASNGKQAVERLRDNKYHEKIDLILTDIMMPEVDGIELCSILSKNPKLKEVPIIVMSVSDHLEATGEVLNESKAQAIGAEGFLQKPLSKDVCRSVVGTHHRLPSNGSSSSSSLLLTTTKNDNNHNNNSGSEEKDSGSLDDPSTFKLAAKESGGLVHVERGTSENNDDEEEKRKKKEDASEKEKMKTTMTVVPQPAAVSARDLATAPVQEEEPETSAPKTSDLASKILPSSEQKKLFSGLSVQLVRAHGGPTAVLELALPPQSHNKVDGSSNDGNDGNEQTSDADRVKLRRSESRSAFQSFIKQNENKNVGVETVALPIDPMSMVFPNLNDGTKAAVAAEDKSASGKKNSGGKKSTKAAPSRLSKKSSSPRETINDTKDIEAAELLLQYQKHFMQMQMQFHLQQQQFMGAAQDAAMAHANAQAYQNMMQSLAMSQQQQQQQQQQQMQQLRQMQMPPGFNPDAAAAAAMFAPSVNGVPPPANNGIGMFSHFQQNQEYVNSFVQALASAVEKVPMTLLHQHQQHHHAPQQPSQPMLHASATEVKSNNIVSNNTNAVVNNTNVASTCAERRALAIARFLKKRKERKFEKKVRYASRKRLAEARPRVRGQFVKKTVATEEVPTTTTAKTTTATTNSDEEANIPSEGTLKMEVAEEE